jgi:hypothetical protein
MKRIESRKNKSKERGKRSGEGKEEKEHGRLNL